LLEHCDRELRPSAYTTPVESIWRSPFIQADSPSRLYGSPANLDSYYHSAYTNRAAHSLSTPRKPEPDFSPVLLVAGLASDRASHAATRHRTGRTAVFYVRKRVCHGAACLSPYARQSRSSTLRNSPWLSQERTCKETWASAPTSSRARILHTVQGGQLAWRCLVHVGVLQARPDAGNSAGVPSHRKHDRKQQGVCFRTKRVLKNTANLLR